MFSGPKHLKSIQTHHSCISVKHTVNPTDTTLGVMMKPVNHLLTSIHIIINKLCLSMSIMSIWDGVTGPQFVTVHNVFYSTNCVNHNLHRYCPCLEKIHIAPSACDVLVLICMQIMFSLPPSFAHLFTLFSLFCPFFLFFPAFPILFFYLCPLTF